VTTTDVNGSFLLAFENTILVLVAHLWNN